MVDERLYKVKASVGQSGLAGIPWLSVMDKELTESTQNGFYISYLFSRNAKRLYVSIALGATQFEDLYGENDKATEKIIKAKELFVKNFNKYSPSDSFEQMDLIDPQDKEFIRQDFSPRMLRRAKNYAGGSFFTKSYNLVDPDFTEDGFASDPKKYIDSYRKIVSDPASSALLEVLDESVFEESDKKQRKNYDYELPSFNPKNIEPKNKNTKKGQSSKPSKPSPPSKKVGDAGEKHVYEYEKNKLVKCGREDLANMIVKQYEDLSFFPGYDIQSFDEEGNKIFIEVKSSKNKKKDYFEISENEINAANELGDVYYVYQVTNALTDPKISTVIKNLMSYETPKKILVEPLVYRITFNQKG